MNRPDFTTTVVGIGLCGLSVFLLLSMATYDPAPYLPHAGQEAPPSANFCGAIGNVFADRLLNTWGCAAYAMPLILLYWAILILRKKEIHRVWLKVTGSMLLLFVMAGIENVVQFPWAVAMGGIGPGGLAGKFVGKDVLGNAGFLGSMIILLTFLAASLFFVGEAALYRTGKEMAVRAVALINGAWAKFSAWRLARAGRGAQAKQFTPKEKRKRVEEFRKKMNKQDEPKPAPASPVQTVMRLAGPLPPPPPVPPATGKPYILPPLDLLDEPAPVNTAGAKDFINDCIETLNTTLENFGIDAAVVDYRRGPAVTMFEIELAAGVKVHKILALSNDLAMALKASGLRIIAPIPGKSTVGIEVPNRAKEFVRLKELLSSEAVKDNLVRIPVLIGKDTAGTPIIEDLARMPHLLIAGTTGSGKSVCINALILSILYRRTPEEVKLILVDPKMVELSGYKDIPHLLTPVVTDMKKAPALLDWATVKMDDRYRLFHQAGVKYIDDYNRLGEARIRELFEDAEGVGGEEIPFHLPHIVIVIDELADLMMVAAKEIQNSITRLAQKSRAVGIHVVVATQRPSVDVITGLIKSNIPARIAFQVTSQVDSRTILDANGAEKLLGSGDCLFLVPGTSNLIRAQGTFVSEPEIRKVVEYARSQGPPSYSQELIKVGVEGMPEDMEKDELYEEAVRLILESQRGSVSLLQRHLQIGYTRAARLIDMMALDGLVGEYKGSKAREVLMTLEDWEARQARQG